MIQTEPPRFLGVDFGKKRIGLALSDSTKRVASPFKQISAQTSLEQTVVHLLKETAPYRIEQIIVGLPLLFSGQDSPMTKLVRRFAQELEQSSQIHTILWDERLSSQEVERVLSAGQVRHKRRKKCRDMLSATLILQSYLDQRTPP